MHDALSQLAGVPIRGSVQPRFRMVAETFAQNFRARDELGASVCVRVEGETVVDLWGGHLTVGGAEWAQDTVGVVFSCTKAATAACLHLLIARGAVELDAPVARYWPGFGCEGKGEITARMVLAHTAGLPALRAPVRAEGWRDPAYMVGLLERERPFWEPGTRLGYHALTFGYLVGEIVRRVSGQSLGRFFGTEIAEPLGLDFSIGLPAEDEPRVTPLVPHRSSRAERSRPFLVEAMKPGTPAHLFVFNSGDWAARGVHTAEGRAVEIPAANGVTNARGLAGMYAGLTDGHLGFSSEAVRGFATEAAFADRDAVLQLPTRFGPGFMLSMGRKLSGEEGLAIGPEAFGHAGMGGSMGFADPSRKLAFGYTLNRLGGGLLLDARGQSLVDATYRSLDGELGSAP